MRLRSAQLIVAMMLALVMGLHWTVLQSVGWMRMFVTFAQTEPIAAAFTKTFDGEHPCSVCKFVQEGKKSTNESGTVKYPTKLDFFCELLKPILVPPPLIRPEIPLSESCAPVTFVPPKPPPRIA